MMYDGWMWGNCRGWAAWVLMCVVMVLFWAATITAIVGLPVLSLRVERVMLAVHRGLISWGSGWAVRMGARRDARGRRPSRAQPPGHTGAPFVRLR